jgi:prepilin-type N-terminal cleavage/methylation domain-containing protein
LKARAHPDRTAGFTLVELLVSMAVLALIALVMAAGLRFVVRAVASTDDRREALEELTLGLSVLRGELERAEPLMIKVGNRDVVLFSGLGDRLRFANVEPPYLAGAPYLAYEYAVTPDRGAYRIDLRRVPVDPDQPDLAAVEAGEPRTILRVPDALRFTYWGRLAPREAPAWHEEWPAGPRLPEAIRLAAGEDPGWPDLVVSLRITAPWYCGGAGQAGGGGEQGGEDVGSGAEAGLGSDTAGTAGCPGSDETGDRGLLRPGSAAETPFGDGAAGFSSGRQDRTR